MGITSFKIEFGSTAWIHFVHTRDAMLRGERAAIVVSKYWRLTQHWCPVCGQSKLQQDTDPAERPIGGPYCDRCPARYELRPGIDSTKVELWLLPGIEFQREDFPPLRYLPFSYPIKYR